MAKDRKTPAARGSIIVISAPSGAGKSTLIKRLMAASPGLSFSVSYTTRAPRATEKNGRDYFFVSRKVFERMVSRGEFVEWADVYGHLYGTAHKQLQTAQEAGQDILLDIDVKGHQQVRQRLPEAVSVFILPPSFAELSRRLRDRHSDAPEEIERRLQTAREEIAHWPEYDYLVVNDHLQGATQALRAIVRAARFRRPSQAGRVEKIIGTFGG
ncbi:MAG TPA: guanylate kinase [Terriglobia bacterium]|nr:guanylate kinase [Terriglobia bacterium]